jgi:hypothetical protein
MAPWNRLTAITKAAAIIRRLVAARRERGVIGPSAMTLADAANQPSDHGWWPGILPTHTWSRSPSGCVKPSPRRAGQTRSRPAFPPRRSTTEIRFDKLHNDAFPAPSSPTGQSIGPCSPRPPKPDMTRASRFAVGKFLATPASSPRFPDAMSSPSVRATLQAHANDEHVDLNHLLQRPKPCPQGLDYSNIAAGLGSRSAQPSHAVGRINRPGEGSGLPPAGVRTPGRLRYHVVADEVGAMAVLTPGRGYVEHPTLLGSDHRAGHEGRRRCLRRGADASVRGRCHGRSRWRLPAGT